VVPFYNSLEFWTHFDLYSSNNHIYQKVIHSTNPSFRMFRQLVPSAKEVEDEQVDKPAQKSVERPNFSIPAMSNNFRRFNARLAISST
jgi:hypothetical protein